jgi:hypothetical protein
MNSEELKYQNLKRETEVIEKVWNLLMQGKFSGAAAQDLAISQMYIQGLHKHLKAECDKIAPLPLPDAVEPVVAHPSPIPDVSTAPLELPVA